MGGRDSEKRRSFYLLLSYIILTTNNPTKNRAYGSATYLRIATVMASGEVAQGQMTSGFSPWD